MGEPRGQLYVRGPWGGIQSKALVDLVTWLGFSHEQWCAVWMRWRQWDVRDIADELDETPATVGLYLRAAREVLLDNESAVLRVLARDASEVLWCMKPEHRGGAPNVPTYPELRPGVYDVRPVVLRQNPAHPMGAAYRRWREMMALLDVADGLREGG